MSATVLMGPHELFPKAIIKRKELYEPKVKKREDGSQYDTQTAVVEVIMMGHEQTFFYSGKAAIAEFKLTPPADLAREWDILVPVQTYIDRESGKPRRSLGTPQFFPAGAFSPSRPAYTGATASDDVPVARRAS